MCPLVAKLPELTFEDVSPKTKEILKAHAVHKSLTPSLMQRVIERYLSILDPNKCYFLADEATPHLTLSEGSLNELIQQYEKGDFAFFFAIHEQFSNSIKRRHALEASLDPLSSPQGVTSGEFKKIEWAKSRDELTERLSRLRSLQRDAIAKLDPATKEKAWQRIAKREQKQESYFLGQQEAEKQQIISANILKAMTSALDSHTVYFTPDEAAQFIIHVQQRLHGIGAQLRDDLNGFTILKIVEGSPAERGGLLREGDRIIAVNQEPVVGMDIEDVVEMIRGEANSEVALTVVRTTAQGDEQKEIRVQRGEVVLKESRYRSTHEPYGTGAIGYLQLSSFYQDDEFSAADDLQHEIERLQQEHPLLGLVLDLRDNSGGLLTQAVAVCSLFMDPGIVVSVKDEKGTIQHLRTLEQRRIWRGPLLILVNRLSASAAEIVAQTLQDYGEAIVIGDPQTFGKGSYQTFTLHATNETEVNPKGEYKVTRGRYYTVSGKTPQLLGVSADIVVPGIYSQEEIGEIFGDYPLESDRIQPNFEDSFSDLSLFQREHVKEVYRHHRQLRNTLYLPYLETLKRNSEHRLQHHLGYQRFLQTLSKEQDKTSDHDAMSEDLASDFQLEESYLVMKDLILMSREQALVEEVAR